MGDLISLLKARATHDAIIEISDCSNEIIDLFRAKKFKASTTACAMAILLGKLKGDGLDIDIEAFIEVGTKLDI